MNDITASPSLRHEQVTQVSIDDLHESAFNPRKTFTGIADLAADIQALGQVLVPLLVRPRTSGLLRDDAQQGFEIVCGHRRTRAAEAAGLASVPCMVRAMSDAEARRAQISENLQRENVHPIEEAEGFQVLMEQDGYSADELAAQVGKSRSYIYGRLKLLQACPTVRQACLAGTVTSEVALLLARLPSVKVQEQALGRISSRGISIEDGGRRSYRSIRSLLAEHYTLRLSEALFDTADPLLLSDAGACTTCPKRTGNAPAFDDLVLEAHNNHTGTPKPGDPDRCTDPACFEAKKKAHLQHKAAQLEARGDTVIDGAKARQAIGADGKVKGDYVALKDVQAALKSAKVKASVVTIQDPRSGKTVKAVKRDELVQAKVMKAEPKGKNHRENYAEQQRQRESEWKQAEEAAKAETFRRRALLLAVRDQAAVRDRTEFELRLVTTAALAGVNWNDRATLIWLYDAGSFEQLQKRTDSMSAAELTTLLLDCAVVDNVFQQSHRASKPGPLLALADYYGIDAKGVMARATLPPRGNVEGSSPLAAARTEQSAAAAQDDWVQA